MGRKSLKEPRQKEIIRAFYKVAKKEGLENASIAKTAEVVGINPSLVMHYFKTKEHLIYGLIEYILDKYLLIYKLPPEYAAHPKKALLAVIDNIFSSKWNTLFDDSVSYSCYSLAFRDRIIKEKYKNLLDALRERLRQLIQDGNDMGILEVEDPALTADIIFVLVDGAYYYLSLVTDRQEYQHKLMRYKRQALTHLNLVAAELAR
ncbi:MAG TPA: TetR/AcrR family transcriptional regulator [Puia sp.]